MNKQHPVSRRNVLKAGGTAALAVGAGSLLTRPALAEDGETTGYDAIVIGAGFAGATAARDLKDKGLRPLVLEARDRVGGRVYSSDYDGVPIERGGAWLHPNYHRTYAEIKRYGLTTVVDVPVEQVIYPRNGSYAPVDPVATSQRVGELLGRVFEGSRDYFPRPEEPLYRADLLKSVDPLSLADRLQALNLSSDDRSLIHGQLATYSGGDAANGGLTALAQWWALCDWSADGWNKMTAARISTGATSLVKAMLNGVDVRLSSPVASVTDSGGKVRVVTRGGQAFSAPVAVVAVPVNIWRTIQFNPGLPAVFANATTEGVGVRPHAAKMWLRVAGVTTRLAAQGEAGDPIASLVTHGYFSNGDALMIALNGPGLNVNDRASVEAALKRIVPTARVLSTKVQDWVNETYTQGGWGMRRPGQMLRQLPAIHQPHGRITFATGDMPNGWIGSFEGAIETGNRAANQAAALI
ncbi:flavin monoamine oxidase family protein [Streptomyces eurythermus]